MIDVRILVPPRPVRRATQRYTGGVYFKKNGMCSPRLPYCTDLWRAWLSATAPVRTRRAGGLAKFAHAMRGEGGEGGSSSKSLYVGRDAVLGAIHEKATPFAAGRRPCMWDGVVRTYSPPYYLVHHHNANANAAPIYSFRWRRARDAGTAQIGGHCVKLIGWGGGGEATVQARGGEGVAEGPRLGLGAPMPPYWLAANEWSTSWGEDGFFRIARGHNDVNFPEYVSAGFAAV